MLSNSQNETADMKHLRVQIEREDRTIKQNTDRLNFKLSEYNDIKKQKEIRQSGQRKDHDAKQSKRLNDELRKQEGLMQKARQDIQELQRHRERLEREKAKVVDEIERAEKQTSNGKNPKAKQDLREKISRSPEIMRIEHSLSDLQKDTQQLTTKLKSAEGVVERQMQQFKRLLQLDGEKLTKEHEREMNSLDDSWLREKNYLEAKIAAAKNIKMRLETEYQSKARQNEIDTARRKKEESEQNARFGSKKGKENFIEANDENPLRDAEKNRFSSRARY